MMTYHFRLISLLVFLPLFTSCKEELPSQPNVIIFLADDQGWGDLSISGNQNLSTPNIDALAREGASFDRFFVSAVCSPTRAELLTGRYHPRSNVSGTSAGSELMDIDEVTFADIFRASGYATGAFGKWHNGSQHPYHPNSRGFDEYYGFTSGHWGNYFSPPLDHNGEIVQGEGFVVDDFTNKAMEFISANKEKPFLAYLPYNTPHSPMQVPDQWWTKFENAELGMRHKEPGLEDLQHTRAALAMVENIDWNVGRLLNHVENLGLTDNTIIIYLTDNGPNGWRWNGGMKGRKGSVDEGGLRSPFFIKWKNRINPGHKIEAIASSIDLLPTLMDLAGIRQDDTGRLDGRSLQSLILDTPGLWQDRNIYSYWREKTSVRNQRFRLDKDDQLFDMESDPGQSEDVASQHPDVHAELVAGKKQFEEEVLSELREESIYFPIGHENSSFTYLPARDGEPTGGIIRSNRYPNDSHFLNWTSVEDEVTWKVDVLSEGDYTVELYYTAGSQSLGTELELSIGNSRLSSKIEIENDPPIMGSENDRSPRQESYVKAFTSMEMGETHFEKGKTTLRLRALNIEGERAPDIKMITFRRKL